MLRFLRIRDLAVLADVEIRFGAGLNLLTGETGAGKSIIVDALGLALGERASAEKVRRGAGRAVVEAVFTLEPGEPALAALAEAGIEVGEGPELVVRREVAAEGGRVFLNGSPGTVSTLRRVGELLFDIHGQHEHLTLLHPDRQLELLDDYAQAAGERADVAREHRELTDLQGRLRRLREDRSGVEERMEILRLRLREFDAVDPRPGEEEELRQERSRLAHGARIAELSSTGWRLLEGEEEEAAALVRLGRLETILEELTGFLSGYGEALEGVRSARYSLEDLAARLRDTATAGPDDPGRLEEIEDRLSRLAALARRHGGDLAAAIEAGRRARDELAGLEAAALDPGALERELERAAARYAEAAARLSTARERAGSRLRRTLAAELRSLAMERARVEIALAREVRPGSPVRIDGAPVAFDARGIDQVEFRLSANPGESLRSLARTASGGELSRIMLALECALLGRRGGSAQRLVFDEVDAGIGGRVAAAVGERLHRISRARQVLCVTHLPQIASRADHHFAVEKKVDGGRTETRVRELDSRGRVAEVARMLAGARVTAATRRHAEEMIGATK